MGIEVLPPDVHSSGVEFTVEGEGIRFGLLAVKNVGQGAIESIIAARAEGGAFRSLTDFCARVDLRLVNSRGHRGAGLGRRAERVRAPGPDPAGPRRRPAAGAGDPAAPGDRPDVGCSNAVPPTRHGRAPAAGPARGARRGSGCAGRRSCSACTSPTTRWARSPSRSARTSTPTAATARTSRSTGSGSSSAGS